MKFEDLGLAEPILRAVAAEGYSTPTPIQVKAIPHILSGSDLLGCAQTGTGKTAAFALPILHRLAAGSIGESFNPQHHHPRAKSDGRKPKAAHHIRCLILCPTRELAAQIGESFRCYGRNLSLKHTVIFGGVNQHHQVKALQRGVDILIATPGRLMDLTNQGYVDLKHVEIFVLDEADRMLDMGFIADIRRVVKQVPAKRQTLLFSATMPPDIRELADTILRSPVSVQVNPVASTVELISQSVYFVPRKGKSNLLQHLIRDWKMGRTLVFTRTKHGADKVVKDLLRGGIRAEAIHGNKSQNHRTRTLNAFKSHTPPVLVATDIASRGIDVDEITHVINFDLPDVPETYVHRIGRTARAGASGVAVSFCDPMEERGDLKAIERLIRRPIEVRRDVPELSGVNEGVALRTGDLAINHALDRAQGSSQHNGAHRGEYQRSRSGSQRQRSGRPHAKSTQRNASVHGVRSTHPTHQPNREGRGGERSHAFSGAKRGFQGRGRGRKRGFSSGGK